jgi:hypothetical protein
VTLLGVLPWRLVARTAPERRPYRASLLDEVEQVRVRLARVPTPPHHPQVKCMRQVAMIGRALSAYQADHREPPAHLSAMVPRYLPDPKLLHCPADSSAGEPGLGWPQLDPKLPVSYIYRLSKTATEPRDWCLGPAYGGRSGPIPLREQVQAQSVYFGDRVPPVQCTHHLRADRWRGSVLVNLSLSGEIYSCPFSPPTDFTAPTVSALLASLERDLAAGPNQFRRNWEPRDVATWFTIARPIPELRDRYRAVAERMAPLTWRLGLGSVGSMSAAVGSLYRAAGETDRAIGACERAAVLLRGKENALALELLAELYREKGDYGRAIATIRRLQKVPPIRTWREKKHYQVMLADTYLDAGRHPEAIKLLERLFAKEPKSPYYRLLVILAQERVGRRGKVVELPVEGAVGAARPARIASL